MGEQTNINETSNIATEKKPGLLKELKDKLEATKANRIERKEVRKEAHTAKKEEFERIRNEKKRTIVQAVCARFKELNSNLTTHFTAALARMEKMLEKLESRLTKATQRGRDTSSCTETIATARAAISSAQSAIDTQQGNTYACEITDEATLGSTLSATKKTLTGDLKDTRDTIQQARQAVTNALRCAKDIRGIDEIPDTANTTNTTSTNSPSPSL